MLSVVLLGERRLLDGADDIGASIQYRKAWALLGYLAVESGRRHSREHLAELLWPALPADAARTNLRQVVANLNRVLDAHGGSGLLLASRDDVGLYPHDGVAIDVHRLERAARLADSAELLAIGDAAAGFGGEFLAGLALDDCPGFEQWLQPVRTRLAGEAMRALQRLFDAQQAAGLAVPAIASARRMAALSPWDDACHRQLMIALAGEGDYAEALATFERLRACLERDLGSAPAPRTLALRDAIQAAMDGAPGGLAAPGAPSRAGTRRWVCGLVARVHPGAGPSDPLLLADLGTHLQAARARVLSSGVDALQACVVAEGQPGDAGGAAVQAARVAAALLEVFPERVSFALCPGIARLEPDGGIALLGNPAEWASHLSAVARPGVALACESLFEHLFETFALQRHAEVALPDVARPARVWRLGREGTRTADEIAHHAMRDAATPGADPSASVPELMTLRIDEASVPVEDALASSAWLTVVEGADRGKRAGIAEQPLILGRASDSDLQLPRRTVSRHHCVVWRDGERYRIRDLGATNRTRVNGAAVLDALLNDGDRVTIGECTLQFARQL
jgi:DNA-binding SARP family transcriptional activator